MNQTKVEELAFGAERLGEAARAPQSGGEGVFGDQPVALHDRVAGARRRGLGTVIGEASARKLAQETGFSKFEKLPIDDPFNQFLALRR